MYYEGPLLDRPNVRPWNLQRTGYAGAQRYGGWIWSGDIDSRWRTLAAQVAVGQNHSLSLSPYWGTDVGGFYPSDELTGELYVRWFQFGTFCPSFRAHGRTWHLRLPWGWNTGEFGPLEHAENPDPNELHNAQVEPICRKYLELRYRLLPYNYTLCREAHDSGLPLMRRSGCITRTIRVRSRRKMSISGAATCWSRRSPFPAQPSARSTFPRDRGTTFGRMSSTPAEATSRAKSTWRRCRSSCGPARSCPWIPCVSTPASPPTSRRPCGSTPGATANFAGTTTTEQASTT